MFSGKQERERLERIIEHLLEVVDKLLGRNTAATSAKGVIMPARILVGGKGATFTYTEFDANGKIVPVKGPINFASDSPGFATVAADATQVVNADGSVSIQVTAVAANADGSDSSAVISGNDSATGLAGADKLAIGPAAVTGGVPVSATGVLTAN